MSRLHVLRAGKGPTLLMLHGIGSSATAWSGQMERLSGQFTCVAPDLPGYGDSPDPRGPGLDSIVDDVANVLDGEPAHMLGVSVRTVERDWLKARLFLLRELDREPEPPDADESGGVA